MAIVIDDVVKHTGGDGEETIPVKKYVVSSNKPNKLGRAGNELEIEAVDEAEAVSKFVRANGLKLDQTSVHKFKAVEVEPKPVTPAKPKVKARGAKKETD